MITTRLAPSLALLVLFSLTEARLLGQEVRQSSGPQTPAPQGEPAPAYDGPIREPAWGPPVIEFPESDISPPAPGPASPPGTQRPGTDEAMMWGLGVNNRSPFRYRSQWEPGAAVAGQPTDLGMWRNELSLMAPLWRSGRDMFLLSLGAADSEFNTNAILPDTGRHFPDELWNVRIGANYIHGFDNGWKGGIGVTVASPSDRPFADLRDVSVGMTAFLRIPVCEHDAWNFVLMYSPVSELPFPLPGVSYQWQPSDDFHMNIGLPFRVMYRPCEDLTLDFSYMLLRTVHAQATYRLGDSWRLYTAFDWESQSWFLHDRESDRERLFSYDKRLSAGVQTTLLEHVQVDLSAGYLFDRFYFTGENFADDHHDRIDLESGLFVSLQASVSW
jgi:Domain of unknown function (DUF6268)